MTRGEPVGELDRRFSAPDASPTPWPRVRRRIEQAELFWISTVRPDGRPHVTPLPTVWRDDTLYFCEGAGEQKHLNLARNPRCALTTGNNAWKSGLDVVIEGTAARVTDEHRLRVLADTWASKYDGDWQFDVAGAAFHHEGGEAFVFEVAPAKILAFTKGTFAQTRFRLSPRLPQRRRRRRTSRAVGRRRLRPTQGEPNGEYARSARVGRGTVPNRGTWSSNGEPE